MEQPGERSSERRSEPEAKPGILDRLLRPFTDVEAGEAGTALLMFLNLFLLLLGYYVLRTVREPLILAGGAEVKSYASAGQALALMGFVPLYGWFSSQVDRVKLIFGFILFFIVNIELFSFGGRVGMPYLGIVYYIWVGIFSLATVAQFWSYANDVYRREAGERLFPFIFLGATLGAPVGARIAERLFEAGVSPYDMMHITAVILCVHLLLYWLVDRRESRRPSQAAAAAARIGGDVGDAVRRWEYSRIVSMHSGGSRLPGHRGQSWQPSPDPVTRTTPPTTIRRQTSRRRPTQATRSPPSFVVRERRTWPTESASQDRRPPPWPPGGGR